MNNGSGWLLEQSNLHFEQFEPQVRELVLYLLFLLVIVLMLFSGTSQVGGGEKSSLFTIYLSVNATIHSKLFHHLTISNVIKYWPWELSVPLCVHKYDEDAPRQDRKSRTGILKQTKWYSVFISFLGFFFCSKMEDFLASANTTFLQKKFRLLDFIWTFV